ncbi:MAG TPA: hypothetical protein PKE37_09685 [Thiomonas arsenitoxydans]|uniref:type IIL restriction-modification enzyme MmeI n=1 Tax=Thiomonas TaxID=32012 RepID=UPI002B6D5B99|nr:type IIL restriction-modification enzyme MmeI [Thiomonas arsenitoxydans]HML82023.1 hypothetical protein [Thiomonas arsenitoxydans]
MVLGNQPYEGGHLIVDKAELEALSLEPRAKDLLVRKFLGSSEVINGTERYCLWITDDVLPLARSIPSVWSRVEQVRSWRLESTRPGTRAMADRPHQFCEMKHPTKCVTIIPIRSSENREYLPVSIFNEMVTVNNLAYAIYDGDLLNFSIIASRMFVPNEN